MEKKYDLIVIGAGPGGYVAAIRGAQGGLKTALVDKYQRLGGTCLLRGCIPTKSLLHSADVLDTCRSAGLHGVDVSDVTANPATIWKTKEKAVTKGAAGIKYLMKKHGVDVLCGHARLDALGSITVAGSDENAGELKVSATNIILATGSAPRPLKVAPFDGVRILNSDHMLDLKRIPDSLAVIGGGAVGVEFASLMARFGARVTVLEMEPRLLPFEDLDVSSGFKKALIKSGITVHTSASVTGVTSNDQGVEIAFSGPDGADRLDAEVLLVAAGRMPQTSLLGLDRVKITLDRGFIPVDAMMRTTAAGVYAIGDIVATPQLAHIASAEALVAVDHILGREPDGLN